MLNNSGNIGHLSLIHDFRVHGFRFSPLRILFTMGLSMHSLH